MGLTTRKNESFTATTKSPAIEGDNIVFFEGGSVIIGGKWVHFRSIRVDLKKMIDDFYPNRGRRIFNEKNGLLYVLITLNADSELEVVPSISFNQTTYGDIKTFENLSGRLPLVLVRLEQDGTNDLSSYKPIISSNIEVFKGVGNFTLAGPEGLTGPAGDTGIRGLLGGQGLTGLSGTMGVTGAVGPIGETGQIGVQGVRGSQGTTADPYIAEKIAPSVSDFSAVPLEGSAPLSVQFSNLTKGIYTYQVWNFGDGNSSTEDNPAHVYTTPGVYTVTLYTMSVDYDDEKVRYDYITVT